MRIGQVSILCAGVPETAPSDGLVMVPWNSQKGVIET